MNINEMEIRCRYDQLVPLKELKPHPKNRNDHPDDQIERLAEILKYQGWRYPIKISNLSGYIISGHGRLMAAQFLKLDSVPVQYQDYESEEQEYADLIADNAVASWSELDLSGINSDILDLGPDFNVDLLGLKDFVVDPIEKLEPQCDEDEVPDALSKPKVVQGEIYILGKHRLMCGDSTVITDFERLMNGKNADMVFTDPPYGMNLETDYKGKMGVTGFRTAKSYNPIYGDNQEFNFKDVYALVESVPEQFWWGADYYCDKLPKGGSWIVWNKRTSEIMKKMYGSHFELCWSKSKHTREIIDITWSGVFGHNKTDDGPTKVHPTMKAIKLIQWFFERFDGASVLDLFGGSGSTLIACEKTDRHCFMMEIDPHYCGVILDRWQKFTGKKAHREDGVLWDEIKGE